jgi:hypothetical protein
VPVFEKILEAREGRTDIGGLPVEKDAPGRGNKNIARIEVEMSERIGNAGILEFSEGGRDLTTESEKFALRERRGRNFRLPLHELRHGVKEGIDEIQKHAGPQVSASRLNQFESSAEGGDLEKRESFGHARPSGFRRTFPEWRAFGFDRKPGVPFGARRENVW